MIPRSLASVDDALAWLAERGARALATDSRRVLPGDAFIAWPGYAVDGRAFVGDARAVGAVGCLVEADGADAFGFDDSDEVAYLPGLKAATGPLASAFLGRPSERLAVVAVTGTNGKTSVTWWVAQAMSHLGRRCGVIGTLGVGEPPRGRAGASDVPAPAPDVEPIAFTGMTTPDPVTVQAGLKRFADAGFAGCALEATSIGLVERRLDGTRIQAALFTNFTQDHLDFHGSMDAYWQAKTALFAWPGLRSAVVNVDDGHGAALVPALAANALDVWTYSSRGDARLRATDVGYAEDGLRFELIEREEGGEGEGGGGAANLASVSTRLIGDYNVANLLAVIGGLRALGVPLADAAAACAVLTPVPGRMQRVPHPSAARPRASYPEVVVDYAHTPDALEKALLALAPLAEERGGMLWCVFGCGGNRDARKRPLMGALAARLAGRVIVTSDNPRLEAPAAIIEQIVAGMPAADARIESIENRADAIVRALRAAETRDVILVAGKGHEDYQDVGGVKHPFSDITQAQTALHRWWPAT